MESRLHKFAVLADTGSFTQAAAELHISQPALSTAVHKLERELQASLFIRGSRPFMLTPAGKIAYGAAKEIALSTSNLRTRLADLSEASITLRIGMIDSIASSLFGSHPGLGILGKHATLSVTVDNSRVLTTAVEQDQLDIAFITGEPRVSNATVQIHPLAAEPLVVVSAAAQYASTRAAIVSGVLPNFISYDQRSTTYQIIQEALHRHSTTAEPTVYSTSPEITLHLVRLGQGVAILPYTMVAPWLETGELLLVRSTDIGVIARPISTVQRRDKILPAPMHRLTRQVRRLLSSATVAAEDEVRSKRT